MIYYKSNTKGKTCKGVKTFYNKYQYFCKPLVSKSSYALYYFKASEQNPVKSPKEHAVLSLATSVYDASLNQKELLPYIIKDNPPLPVVKNQQIMITAQTGGQSSLLLSNKEKNLKNFCIMVKMK